MSKENPEPVKTNFETNKIKEHINLFNKMIIDIKKKDTNNLPFDCEMEIMMKYPEFYQEHPFLVKKLTKGDDLTMVYTMLENLDSVQNGNKSLASVELNLGEQLANKYLYPNIKK
jgi:hypothetical protein